MKTVGEALAFLYLFGPLSFGSTSVDLSYGSSSWNIHPSLVAPVQAPPSSLLLAHTFKSSTRGASSATSLAFIRKFKPKNAILTNLSPVLDYKILKKKLPKNVIPAHDGLTIKL